MHGATHRQAATRVPARIKTIRLALVAAMLVAGVGMSQASMARAAEFTVSVDDIAALTGLTAVVAHSGDGVNVRASASAGAEIIGTLADGEVVALRVDAVDTVLDGDGTRWWPVSAGGRDGWIAGFYLDSASGAPASTDGASAPDASSAAPEFSNGQRVAVRTDDGGGLVMRAGPSSAEDRIAVLGDGDVVQIVDGPFFDGAGSAWFKITDGDTTAYVFGAFLTAADQLPASTGQPAPEAAAFAVNDYVAPASGSVGVNVRKRAALSGKFIGSLAEGTVAQVVDGPAFDADGSAWYGVASGSIQGYALGDLLQASKAPAAAAPAAPPAPKTGPTGSFMYPLSSYVFTQGFGCTIYDF
ncbi:MAG: SH3 domain-containing protein, partial [Thermomicrobiales bacterium]